jgi:hypothetical protein
LFDVLPLVFVGVAFGLHHKPWMQLSIAFWGFVLLQEAWEWRDYWRGNRGEPKRRLPPRDRVFAVLALALLGIGGVYVLWVPDSACVFCVRDATR